MINKDTTDSRGARLSNVESLGVSYESVALHYSEREFGSYGAYTNMLDGRVHVV